MTFCHAFLFYHHREAILERQTLCFFMVTMKKTIIWRE